jgi:hypothetical protein
VRGSCPQITEQEAAADDDDNRYKERFHAALLFLLPERLTVGDSQLRRSPINIYQKFKTCNLFLEYGL